MKATVALWMTLALVALALLPAAWVLGREALRRRATKKARLEIEDARRIVGEADGADVAGLARSLRERFGALSVERVVVELLRDPDAKRRAWGARLFAEVGLLEPYAKRVREAARWSERTHAAEVLGLAGASGAVSALVAALRDRQEDQGSVKVAAASALAKLRDPSAIPLLVRELADVDENSSRSVAEAVTAFGALAVPALLELLADSAAPAARVWAARILGRIGDTSATDDLVVRLHDRDDRLRMAAAEALGFLADSRALQALVRATLRDPAPQVRAHAAGAVAKIEGERAIDVLVAALADPDYATRLRALEAFETMRIEDTSPLETALRDPNAEVRRRAALALERVGYLDRVVKRLTSDDRRDQMRAYAELLEFGQVGLVESVASYVHHASFEVRALAARACGELVASRAAPVLLRAMDDDAWPVRAAVTEALGRLRDPTAHAALVRALADESEPVREAAAEALTSSPPAELAPYLDALTAAYDRGSVAVRRNVVIVAGRIEVDAAEALIVRASADPSESVRLPAVKALGDRGGDARVEPLVARLTDSSLDVRMAAVSALGSVARIEAFEGLLRALAGAPPAVRDRIAEALARGARDAIFERMPDLERSTSLDVRLGVAWTLGKIGDAKGVPTLAKLLRDPDAKLRASAVGALGKIADAASRDALLAVAEDPDGRVRAALVNALSRGEGSDPRVLAVLERRTSDPDAFVRDRAVIAFARAGGAAVADAVRAADVQPAARLVASALLGTDDALGSVLDAIAEEGALDRVLAFLEREEAGVRAAFFGALRIEDPRAPGAAGADLAALLAQYDKTVRSSLDVDARRLAVSALARLGATQSLVVLSDALLGDPSEAVRLGAANAIARYVNDDRARRSLTRAIADPNAEVAIAAVRAIATRREREVVAALQQRLGAGAPAVQDVVEATLAEIHRADPMPFLDWMMGIDVPDLLTPGVRVLARIASAVTLPLLEQLAHSRSAAVRAESVRAIGALGTKQAAAAIDAMMHDPNEDVRVAVLESIDAHAASLFRTAPLRRDPSVRVRALAAAMLERITGSEARGAHKALDAMLADPAAVVRAAALASLAGSSDPEGLAAFARAFALTTLDTRLELRKEPRGLAIGERVAARLASSGDPHERKNAVVALGAFGATGYDVHVLPALRDPSPAVRVAAVFALAAVDDDEVRRRLRELLDDPDAAVQDAVRRSLVQTVT